MIALPPFLNAAHFLYLFIEHLGCLSLLAGVHSTAANTSAWISAQVSTSGLFQGWGGCIPRNESLCPTVILCLIFQGSTFPITRLTFTQHLIYLIKFLKIPLTHSTYFLLHQNYAMNKNNESKPCSQGSC